MFNVEAACCVVYLCTKKEESVRVGWRSQSSKDSFRQYLYIYSLFGGTGFVWMHAGCWEARLMQTCSGSMLGPQADWRLERGAFVAATWKICEIITITIGWKSIVLEHSLGKIHEISQDLGVGNSLGGVCFQALHSMCHCFHFHGQAGCNKSLCMILPFCFTVKPQPDLQKGGKNLSAR